MPKMTAQCLEVHLVCEKLKPNFMPSYPLAFPSGIAPESDEMELVSSSAGYQSVYTGQADYQALDGQWWKRRLSFPPMNRATAEPLISFLSRLQGQVGTFTCGMFLSSAAQGSTTGALPTVASFSSDGTSLSITAGPLNRLNYLLAGDYFAINGYIFKALENVSTDGSGAATFDVAPRVVSTKVTIGNSLAVDNPQGTWRLMNNSVSWSINKARTFGVEIEMMENI